MRAYIKALEHVRKKGMVNYEFSFGIGDARFWPTIHIAEGIRDQIALAGGITTPEGVLFNFQVEPRPHGGFVVYCEY